MGEDTAAPGQLYTWTAARTRACLPAEALLDAGEQAAELPGVRGFEPFEHVVELHRDVVGAGGRRGVGQASPVGHLDECTSSQ